MKKNHLWNLLVVFAITIFSLSLVACSSKNNEDDFEEITQTGNQKPSIWVSDARVEYVNKIYTLEVTFGVSGIQAGQTVKVEMKYGSSYQNMNYTRTASKMNYSSERYMVRLSNRRKGETIAFKGILTVDGKEVSSTQSTRRIN
jgi:maltose-binding protein MalE